MAITSAFQADDAGSIPAARSSRTCVADIAQLVERTLGKGEVGGSNPPISTSFKQYFPFDIYLITIFLVAWSSKPPKSVPRGTIHV